MPTQDFKPGAKWSNNSVDPPAYKGVSKRYDAKATWAAGYLLVPSPRACTAPSAFGPTSYGEPREVSGICGSRAA